MHRLRWLGFVWFCWDLTFRLHNPLRPARFTVLTTTTSTSTTRPSSAQETPTKPAVGIATGGNGKVYAGNLTPYVLVTYIVASMGGLIFGYDIGISGGVTSMDSFLKKFFQSMNHKKEKDKMNNQYCQYDSQTLTMFTSSLYLAALISSIVAATVTRKFGRKLSMLFGGLLFCSGAIINAAAKAVWMLILGRMLLGFGIRFSNQVDYCFIVNAILDAVISAIGIVGNLSPDQLQTFRSQSYLVRESFASAGDIETMRGRMDQLLQDFDCFSTVSIFSTKNQQQNN